MLSREEVIRALNATSCLKLQTGLSVAYGAGQRVAEVAAIKVTDIDSARMLIRKARGKAGSTRRLFARLIADA